MEPEPKRHVIKKLSFTNSLSKIFIAILAVALLGGVGTGYILASTSSKSNVSGGATPEVKEAAKTAQSDNHTFRDFAEGTIEKKPVDKNDDYSEGTHLLKRTNAVPVALTSSVVDLSQYEGKKVKVYGETQKALKTGWLMDVGKVDVEQ